MQEFDVFYYHSPITYTLTRSIIDQEKKVFFCEIGGRGVGNAQTLAVEDDGVWDIPKTVRFLKILADIATVCHKPIHIHIPHTAFLLGKIIKFSDRITSYSYIEEGVFSYSKINHIINDEEIDVVLLESMLQEKNLYVDLGISDLMISNINKIMNYYYDFEHPKFRTAYCISKMAFEGVSNRCLLQLDLSKIREIQFKDTLLVILPPLIQILVLFGVDWHLAIQNLMNLIASVTQRSQYSQFQVVLKTHPQDEALKQTNSGFSLIIEQFRKYGQMYEDIVFPANLDRHLEPALLGFERYLVIGSSSALWYLKSFLEPGCYEHIDLNDPKNPQVNSQK